MAYRPDSEDIARIVVGDLNDPKKQNRALDIATLANRPEVNIMVDGHAIVSRHLAILAMTGAGKSVTARRIIEELAKKNYPIVIFDPHGDYTGLGDVPNLKDKVQRFYAQFPLFEEDSETVAEIVSSLGYELNPNMRTVFGDVFSVAKTYIDADNDEKNVRDEWLADFLSNSQLKSGGLNRDLWLVANLAEAAEISIRNKDKKSSEISDEQQKLIDWGWEKLKNYSGTDAKTLEAIKKRVRRAASVLRRMETTNQKVAATSTALPNNRKDLVKYGQISVVSLAGYTSDFQATIYSLIANEIFDARINGDLKLPVLFLLEEAHNFVPARGNSPAELRSIETTKQIAQEGRKFGVGLILISQRPSRLDETTLSQCNSFVIMRMVNPADQNFVRRVIESLGEDEAKNLPNLDVGEALLSGQMINFPVLVKIKEPESKGEREEKDAFVALQEAHDEMLKSQRK
ncbi:MAG: ATP-binding protein [Pyrinomonadaceae bacterium]